jgi:hypothetical protein
MSETHFVGLQGKLKWPGTQSAGGFDKFLKFLEKICGMFVMIFL